jgi:hypothetical protein
MSDIRLDGTDLRRLLDLVGAPAEPTPEAKAEVERLEDMLGKPLPAETRAYLLTPIALDHDEDEHPYCAMDFWCGLPDVDAFIDSFDAPDSWAQGFFNATCHFLGLYPIGVHIQYGDFSYALAMLDAYAEGVGGVMYYDEREVGGWSATLSGFLHRAIEDFWTQCDGEVDGEDADDVEIDIHDLRDCFKLEGYDWRARPPVAEAIPEDIEATYEAAWRSRMALVSRWWIVPFIARRVDRVTLDDLPTPQQWDAQKESVTRTHHDAMYWLFAHMLLDNQPELAECIALSRKNPSKIVAAVADRFESGALSAEWEETRAELYVKVREARA